MFGMQRARRLFGHWSRSREDLAELGGDIALAPGRAMDESPEFAPTVSMPAAAADAASGALLHWPPSGRFPLQALREAFHRDAIRAFARNAPTERALVFCTATLVPEHDDAWDANAIAVWIGSSKVAHLMRPDAQRVREFLSGSRIALQSTTCDAIITGGEVGSGRESPYVVELDVDLSGPPPTVSTPTYVTPLRLPNAPQVSRDPDGEYAIRVPYMTLSALQHCSVGSKLRLETREGIGEIHIFEPGSVAGSGRVAVLKTQDVPELASDIDAAVATVRQIGVRSCLIDCALRRSRRAADGAVSVTRGSQAEHA